MATLKVVREPTRPWRTWQWIGLGIGAALLLVCLTLAGLVFPLAPQLGNRYSIFLVNFVVYVTYLSLLCLQFRVCFLILPTLARRQKAWRVGLWIALFTALLFSVFAILHLLSSFRNDTRPDPDSWMFLNLIMMFQLFLYWDKSALKPPAAVRPASDASGP